MINEQILSTIIVVILLIVTFICVHFYIKQKENEEKCKYCNSNKIEVFGGIGIVGKMCMECKKTL